MHLIDHNHNRLADKTVVARPMQSLILYVCWRSVRKTRLRPQLIPDCVLQ